MAGIGATQTSHVGMHVRDIDRSLAYYQDALGLDLVAREKVSSPWVGELLGRPGAEIDRAILRLPESPAFMELVRYTNCEGTPIDPLHGNPGSFHVAFYTADLPETWATLEALGSELQGDGITSIEGGVFDGGKVIYCTDPDGIRVEFLSGPAYLDGSYRDADAVPKLTRANETSHVGIHVRELAPAVDFWVGQLGFEVVAQWVANDPGTRHVIGEPTADLNMAMLRLPGWNAYFEVIEYQNAPGRVQVDPNHFNPGTCHVAVYVDDLDATWAALSASGRERISDHVVRIPDGALAGGGAIYVTDPDGFRVELIQAPTYLDGSPRGRIVSS